MEMKCKARKIPSSFSPDKENQDSNWLKLKTKKSINRVLFKMRLNSLTPKQTKPFNPTTQNTPPSVSSHPTTKKTRSLFTQVQLGAVSDKISLLSDEILLKILSKLPESQRDSNSLVSRRWLDVQGKLVRSIKLLEWDFLVSGRLFLRFPNLVDVDLVGGCFFSPKNSGIFCNHKSVCVHVGCDVGEGKKNCFFSENFVLGADEVDGGLRVLACLCQNLKKLAVVNCSEMGLLGLAENCPTLQELELLKCSDQVLRGIAACRNLQILRLTGNVDGLYNSSVSDVGLTILAQGCKNLLTLELSGCMGSYEGIRAIGQCCQMLEELTFRDHRMEGGWLTALSYCENLKCLKFVSCKGIDVCGGVDEDLGSCSGVERVYLEKCQLRDKRSLSGLFLICHNVRKVIFKSCWGLNDDMFFAASSVLRKVSFLSLEGCSMLTTRGLESVITSWNDLESLKVYSCNSIKDCEVNPTLSSVFSALKDLKWKPDTKSIISSNLYGTGMGKRGGKFFGKSL